MVPRITGENCYGPAKLRMIEAWLAAEGIAREKAHIRFYSDHVSDAPTLDWADEAFAVNPHGPLRAMAVGRGWTIFDWR
jgi:phosphoserine phosphatase